MTKQSVESLKQAVIDLCGMINGLDIAIERIKLRKEYFLFHHEPYSTSDELLFSLDIVYEELKSDRRELKDAKMKAQRELWDVIG